MYVPRKKILRYPTEKNIEENEQTILNFWTMANSFQCGLAIKSRSSQFAYGTATRSPFRLRATLFA